MARKSTTPRWNETNFKQIDVIVSSGEIRREFFKRCKELQVDPYEVALKAGIKPSIFKDNYVDNPEPVSTKHFSQTKFIEALEIVGIQIKVLVKMKPYSEVYVSLKQKGIK